MKKILLAIFLISVLSLSACSNTNLQEENLNSNNQEQILGETNIENNLEEEQSNTENIKQKDIELENLKWTELSLNDDVRISLNGKDISLTYLAYNYTKDCLGEQVNSYLYISDLESDSHNDVFYMKHINQDSFGAATPPFDAIPNNFTAKINSKSYITKLSDPITNKDYLVVCGSAQQWNSMDFTQTQIAIFDDNYSCLAMYVSTMPNNLDVKVTEDSLIFDCAELIKYNENKSKEVIFSDSTVPGQSIVKYQGSDNTVNVTININDGKITEDVK